MIKNSPKIRGLAKTQYEFVPFNFGVDIVTPSNSRAAGSLRDAINYEINLNGGYTGIEGYERFDGRTLASNATYAWVAITVTGSLSVGNTVTDSVTGATGTVLAIDTTYNPLQTYAVISLPVSPATPVGQFEAGGTLQVGGTPRANITANELVNGAPSMGLNAYYLSLAQDNYRPTIGTVGGAGATGPVRGIFVAEDIVYAVRNNNTNTAAVIYKATSSGWTAIALGKEMYFTSGGTTEITEGSTITGITSGATAIVRRVILTSGSWAAGTAAGKLVFHAADQTGNFQAAEGVKIMPSATDLATITANSATITLLPDGLFRFFSYNFRGLAQKDRVYGVDGVNKAFEFDSEFGLVITISTGMAQDKPTHVIAHKNHLFLAFEGSLQHSSIGDPYTFTVVLGAGEFSVGDKITGLSVQPSSTGSAALAVASRNRIHILYGTSVLDWELLQYRREVGCFEDTIQEFGMTMMLDERGVITLNAVQEYGNFSHSLITKYLQPWITSRITLSSCSCIARNKSQYRVFFTDGAALYITVDNQKILGVMTEALTIAPRVIVSQEEKDGNESIYFGASNGYVYKLDSGNSFDGTAIRRGLVTNFHHSKSPRIEKSYFDISFEVTGSGYSFFDFRYELGYGQTDIPQPYNKMAEVAFSAPFWDAFTWDQFVWDGTILSPTNLELNGSGENLSLVINSESAYIAPITFTGAQIRYAYRQQLHS